MTFERVVDLFARHRSRLGWPGQAQQWWKRKAIADGANTEPLPENRSAIFDPPSRGGFSHIAYCIAAFIAFPRRVECMPS